MGRGPLTFKHTDIVRAVRALQSQGLEIVRTDISPDGRVSIFHKLTEKAEADDAETFYQSWKAKQNAGAS